MADVKELNINNTTYNIKDAFARSSLNSKADTDLANLTPDGESRLHALKGYLDNGELLTDPEGLADVKYYAHSTFDLSKFTVVGSPTITDDGIASGFSGSNYLTTSNIRLSNNAVFEFRILSTINTSFSYLFSSNNTTTYYDGLKLYREASTLKLVIATSNSTNITETIFTDLQLNRYYDIKIIINNTNIKVLIDGVLTKEINLSSNIYWASVTNTQFIVGTRRTGSGGVETIGIWQGSIDLKQFSITVDGVPVFSGNKTGIDTIKPDDYTVVGTPTISADGVASGFSSSNYLTIPISFNKPFKFSMAFTTGNSFNTNQYLLITSARGLQVLLGSTGKFRVICGTTSWGTDILNYTGSNSLSTNTNYIFELEFTGTKYNAKLNGDVLASVNTISLINTDTGANIGAYSSEYWQGSIDLNAFKIYVDGNLVYQPCLKIPYTQSKTGSKIVDSYYRSRVSDMANQEGYAPYYTLQEDIGNYTVVGSPTINNGVVSGFSSANYITTPVIDLSTTTNWEIYTKFTTGAISDQTVFNLGGYAGLNIYNGNLSFTNGVSPQYVSSIVNAQANSIYELVIGCNGTQYYIKYKVNGVQQTDITQNASVSLNNSVITLGYHPTANQAFAGTIDLKEFKIYIDGSLIYTPAPNFTLPQGEIYGTIKSDTVETIEDKSLVAGYLNEGYEIKDKKEIELVNKYTHSTFDLSKFTVVGSPTITNDGITSGFSTRNGLGTIAFAPSTKTWSIKAKFTTPSTLTGVNNIIGGVSSRDFDVPSVRISGTYFSILLSNSGTSWDIANIGGSYIVQPDTTYWCELSFTGTQYLLKYSLDGINYTTDITVTNSNPIYQGGYYLGIGNALYSAVSANRYFNGSIDLKQFSITVDGMPVFNGNKTGIDTIKSDYTPLPTNDPCPVTPDGVASGFSYAKYITSDYELTTNYSTLEIDLGEVTIGSLPSVSATMWLLHAIETNSSISKGFWFGINGSGKSRYYAGSGSSNYDIANNQVGSIVYSAGQKIKFKLVYNGTQYVLYSSINGGTWTQDGNAIISDKKINFDVTIKIGTDGSANAFLGSVDLNRMRIIADGKVVWQPCLKIPYTQSKTGSKVVDSYYRSRVEDAYSQFGSANYFVQDNDYVIKPYGEIYGLIGQQTLRKSSVSGINRSFLYSDRTLLLTGSCTSGVEVTLPTPFVNSNYMLSVPYSAKSATAFTPTQTGDWFAIGEGVL